MLGGRRGNNGGGVRDTNYGVSGRPKAEGGNWETREMWKCSECLYWEVGTPNHLISVVMEMGPHLTMSHFILKS